MSEAIRKIWDAIKYGPEDKLITFESPNKGGIIYQCTTTTNKRTGQITRKRELIKEGDEDE
jgi:hypothetical protein|tara:strand:- start:980 stop:1162 length:183 start_codon:yes stop_codon:yes gene_type:complete